MRPRHANRGGQLIDPRRQNQILALGKLHVDRLRRINIRARNIKPRNRNRLSRRFPTAPRNPEAVAVQRRNPHAELARGIQLQERLLAHHWRMRYLRVRRRGPCAFRGMHHADKHHVPVRTRPTLPVAVARDPLLLAAGVNIPVHQRIRHPAPACPAMILVQHQVAAYVHAPQRHCLRDRPLHRAASRLYGEPPTALQKVVVALLCFWMACDGIADRRSAHWVRTPASRRSPQGSAGMSSPSAAPLALAARSTTRTTRKRTAGYKRKTGPISAS